jgi:hypothetical protein
MDWQLWESDRELFQRELDSFLWLSSENTHFTAAYADVRPTWVGLESLRVLKLAAFSLRLSDAEVEAIFWGNAQKVWGSR